MKKLFSLFLLIMAAITLHGQNNYQDVVYLKNGSIIRGIIIEQVPNKTIKIETADRNVFVYQIDEIEKITKEQQVQRDVSLKNEGLKPGYRGIVELGYQFGVGELAMDRIKFNVINGYQVNPYFAVGFGTGFRYYIEQDAFLMPFFGDFRANFVDGAISPYLALSVGYTFDATNEFDGVGPLVNPVLGVSFKIADKSTVNTGLGYDVQRIIFRDFHGDIQKESAGAICINVGISF